MQSSQRLQTLLLTMVVYEPARRLGEQQDQQGQDDCWHDLYPERDAPLRRPRQVEGPVADPAGDERSDAQHELLQRCDPAADGRVRDLALVDGDDHDEEADAQPRDATAGP